MIGYERQKVYPEACRHKILVDYYRTYPRENGGLSLKNGANSETKKSI
jgi:hypothetical protein